MIRRLPLPLADAIAWGVAWVWWFVLPIRRDVAIANLRGALPGAPARATLVRAAHDVALGYLELGRSDVRIDFVGADGPPPGAILVTAHLGSWDLGLLAAGRRHPLAIFLRRPSNRRVARWIDAARRDAGIEGLYDGARKEHGYAALAAGKHLVFVFDQRHARGIEVPFFGRPARTSPAAAAAHLRTGRPIWTVRMRRLGLGHHTLTYTPFEVPPGADAARITELLNLWIEDAIREAPHAWWWLHRRWG